MFLKSFHSFLMYTRGTLTIPSVTLHKFNQFCSVMNSEIYSLMMRMHVYVEETWIMTLHIHEGYNLMS